MYSILASGTDTRWIPGGRDADYELSPETAARWVHETSPDIVFLCSPNTLFAVSERVDFVPYDTCMSELAETRIRSPA